jgi:hypothetical protein
MDLEFILIEFNLIINRIRLVNQIDAQKKHQENEDVGQIYRQKMNDLQTIEAELESLRAKLIARL